MTGVLHCQYRSYREFKNARQVSYSYFHETDSHATQLESPFSKSFGSTLTGQDSITSATIRNILQQDES